MRNERFKGQHYSLPRTRLEPLKPEAGFPRANQISACSSYMHQINGHLWMCYCVVRRDWLIRTLVKAGINVIEFQILNSKISRHKCRKIASCLQQYLKSMSHRIDGMQQSLTKQDIKFYAHCGGLRVHDWGEAY